MSSRNGCCMCCGDVQVVSYPTSAPKPTSICGLALDQGYDATPTAEALARERVIARGNCAAWCLQQDVRYQVCITCPYQPPALTKSRHRCASYC
jgi:hypothetical protein